MRHSSLLGGFEQIRACQAEAGARDIGKPARRFRGSSPLGRSRMGLPPTREEDYARASLLLAPFAGKDHAPDQCIVGRMFQAGEGVPQFSALAVWWFRKAAELRPDTQTGPEHPAM